MPDRRRHRGPHPGDAKLFGPEMWPALRSAVRDLSWLLSRGYASTSSLKIVGDRYSLDKRQRVAVARCACSDEARARRQLHRLEPNDLRGQLLWIDGYNVLTSVEAALAGGVILKARDGCFRDMASMHGSYRKVAETMPAIELLGELLAELAVGHCRWLLDSPVSNSGRLKKVLLHAASEANWDWSVELVPNPDAVLIESPHVVASSDSEVIDGCRCWSNLARLAIERHVPQAYLVEISTDEI